MQKSLSFMKNSNNQEKAPEQENFLECEKGWIFLLLMFVSGIYGAYTYSIRGGVFCNAQTANFVLFAMALGNGELRQASYYLIPMSAYLLGAMISEAVPKPIKRMRFLRWDTVLIFIEIAVVIILGCLPEDVPVQVSQVTINFICSMQYNTFRQAQGIPMATTFCTNHLRQTGIALAKIIRKRSARKNTARAVSHLKMLFTFVAGGIISTLLCRYFLGKAIWVALLPLSIIFADFLYADLKKECGYLDRVPRGHE